MSGFDQVIKLTEEEPLSRSLPAALRLANALPDQTWSEWLRLELMGYTRDNPSLKESTVVPTYRSVAGQWRDEYGRLFLVPDPKLGFVNETRLRFGVAELESVMSNGTGTVGMRLPGEAEIIRRELNVDVSIFEFQRAAISQVLANIRLKALEHLWERKPALTTPAAEVKLQKQDEIILLRPAIWGMGIDLRALWKRMRGR